VAKDGIEFETSGRRFGRVFLAERWNLLTIWTEKEQEAPVVVPFLQDALLQVIV